MGIIQKVSLASLRIGLGWLFFYAGLTKILDRSWSAASFLEKAKTLPSFYHWLMSANILPVVNFLNIWGPILIGAALILGICVRLSAYSGGLLMLLYYLPRLNFPYTSSGQLLVDQHIIIILALFVLAFFKAGNIWGLEKIIARKPFFQKHPRLAHFTG